MNYDIIKPKYIKEVVEKISGIEDISIRNRERFYSDCRSVYVELCRRFCITSLIKVGRTINRTHASIINNQKQFKNNYGKSWFSANEIYEKSLEYILVENRQLTPINLKESDPKNYYKILYIRHQNKTRSVINKLFYKLKNEREKNKELKNK